MTILYVANDRHAADAAAFALRTVAPDVEVAWAASLRGARRWLDDNQDVDTLIVEVESDNPGCELFISEVRAVGVTAPVVVVSLNDPAPPLTALRGVAAEIVTKGLTFFDDLPDIVRRSHTARPSRRRLRLLYVGDAALARQCLGRPGGSIEVVEAGPDPCTEFHLFDIVLIEHGYPGVETLAILEAMAGRQLHIPVVIVAEWDEALAVMALKVGAIDYVARSQASLRAVFFRLNRLIAHSALLTEQSRLRDALENVEQRLTDAMGAIEHARWDRLADAALAAEHDAQLESHFAARQQAESDGFALRQAELETALTDGAAERSILEAKLAEAEVSRREAEQLRLAEAAASADRIAQLEQAHRDRSDDVAAAAEDLAQREAELAGEITSRGLLAKELADATLALRRAEEHQALEEAAADARFAEHQTRFDALVSETAAAQEALQARLVAVEAAHQHARHQHAAEIAEAHAKRQALGKQLEDAEAALLRAQRQHASEMGEAAAAADALEKTLADVANVRQRADEQHMSELAAAARAAEAAEQHAAAGREAAAEQAARRQAGLESELRQERDRRQEAERACVDTRAASEQAQISFLDQVSAMRQSAREHEARLEARIVRERAEGDLARQSLAATEERIQRLESAHTEEQANLERARLAIEADLARQCAEHAALQQTLARFEALVAQRDTQLAEQAAHRQASDQAAATTLADVEHHLRLTLAAAGRDKGVIAELQEQLKAAGEELETTRSQREVLKVAADRVPQLRKQIDDIRAENRRRFENVPANMCRCSPDGAITQASYSFASLLGFDTPEEVQQVDFAGMVFQSGDELQWIIDRCLTSRSTESIETTWRRKDGSRIIVRVLAVATTADSVDLAAQDITAVRVLEERLRSSQRMEAVGRYGSEVAVNCGNLLRHVEQEGQQWLARIDSDTARYHGELLLDEVTRAAGFLRQLGVYGNEQKNAPDELVDVNRVLRDLAPVLKRVAGGNIELVLPKFSTPLNLDVDAERVERMLVNVAAYGRERMPLGGRLMIEVASVVVDREFVAKYPNVRPGPHVLLTVNEVRGVPRSNFLAAARTRASGTNATASSQENPGVDLGALQALVSDCGGHLWMTAEPPGDMMLKIHLPRRVLDIRH